MNEEQLLSAEELLDELLEALGDMVDMTCPSMRPLWLRASREARQMLVHRPSDLPDYPRHLLRVGSSTRSKYQTLAGWRHAVVWQDLLERGDIFEDPDESQALKLVYFQPYPENRPPYSYSGRRSDAPGRPPDQSSGNLSAWAALGCLSVLRALFAAEERYLTQRDEGRLDFVKLGLKRSLRDVLKLEWEDIPQWTDGAGDA